MSEKTYIEGQAVDIGEIEKQIRKTERKMTDAKERGDAAALSNLEKKRNQLEGILYLAKEPWRKKEPEQERTGNIQREAQYEGCLESIMIHMIVLRRYLQEGERLSKEMMARHAAKDSRECIADQIEVRNLFTMSAHIAEAIIRSYDMLTEKLNAGDENQNNRQDDDAAAGGEQERQRDGIEE